MENTPEAAGGTDTFTPAEKAYFDSRGTAELPQETPAETTTEQVETEPAKAATVEETVTDEGEEQVQVNNGTEKKQFVPLKALQEARRERQEAAERVRNVELELARASERIKFFEQAYQRQAEPAQPPPSPDDDFIGALKHNGDRVQTVEQKLAQFEQEKQQQAQYQHIMGEYVKDAARVRAEKPEFDDAYKFLIDGRREEYKALGYHGDQVEQALRNEELSIVVDCMKRGTKPADTVLSLAKARGYQARPKQDDTAAEKLATIQKGQEANRSLSSVGGEGGADNMTKTKLIAMSDDEFLAYRDKNPTLVRKIMSS